MRDRILIPAAGLVLIFLSAVLIMDVYFEKYQLMWISRQLAIDSIKRKIVFGVVIALMLLDGIYCLSVLFRRISRRKGFVVEKREGGELAISVKALESLVTKCLAPYDAVTCKSIHLHNEREGLVIGLRTGVRRGTNIPMLADSLQKQIRQYVTDCTGCDVKRVYVQVDSMDAAGENTAYHVPDPVDPVAEHLKSQDESAAQDEAKTPIHQRLFGHKDQPADLPPAPAAEAEAPQPAPNPEPAEKPEAPVNQEAETAKPEQETAPAVDNRPWHQRLFGKREEPVEAVATATAEPVKPETASEATEPQPAEPGDGQQQETESAGEAETPDSESVTAEQLPFLDTWESEAKRND